MVMSARSGAWGACDRRVGSLILVMMTKPPVTRRLLPTSPFAPPVEPQLKTFAVGDRVTHDEHGLGRVVGIEDEIAVLVDFGSIQRKIMHPYTKLTKL